MKNRLASILLLVTISVAGQGALIPFKSLDGKWGYCDENRKTIIKSVYNRVGLFRDGLAIVKNREDKYGLIDTKEKIIISFDDHNIQIDFNGYKYSREYVYEKERNKIGLIMVVNDEYRLFYKKDGTLVYKEKFKNRTRIQVKGSFKDSSLTYIVTNDDSLTIFKSNGEILINNQCLYFSDAFNLNNGISDELYFKLAKKVIVKKESTEYQYDDEYEDEYEYRGSYDREINYYGIMNLKGEMIIPFSKEYLDINLQGYRYSSSSANKTHFKIKKSVHLSEDCEPKELYGVYSLKLNKEIISTTLDRIQYFDKPKEKEGHYEDYDYTRSDSIEEVNNSNRLKIVNSSQTFSSKKEFDLALEKSTVTLPSRPKIKVSNGLYIIGVKDEQTLVYKVVNNEVELFQTLDTVFRGSEKVYSDKGVIKAKFEGDFTRGDMVYMNLTDNKFINENGVQWLGKEKLYGIIENSSDKFQFVNNKEEVIFDAHFKTFEDLNDTTYAVLSNGKMDVVSVVDNKKKPTFKYFELFRPNESMLDLAQENDTNYFKGKDYEDLPLITVTDKGFGLIDSKENELIPAQEFVLNFQYIDNTIMVAKYMLTPLMKQSKKLLGYYDLKGRYYSVN